MPARAPEPRTSNASLDRSARRFGLHDAIVTPASQPGTNVLDDFETGRHVLQDFRDIFAEMLSPDKLLASEEPFALRVASDRATVAAQVALPQCLVGLVPSPRLFLSFVLLLVIPAAVPVVRSGNPSSPTSGRTACDAVSRSAASSVQFPRRAKRAVSDARRLAHAASG
jgi:hypothetical protein